MRNLDRRIACKISATVLGVLSAGIGFWSSQVEVPQVGTVYADGYVDASREIFAALKQQGNLSAWAAVAAAGAAIAAAFS
ncbi:hypothetical protein MKK63_20395 [Methylobacterium sp. J-088]|uniref:hypothetical protein n=1 Tax=Methylobacterium sp. J-088 TaxID=2836664 RepID=UPI001FBA6491|nr:hypothetical protein [Methylobacterium sp. J-088]MCJ2065052.1 hypothetical protein [Methylobacterium sp. J-088]